MAFARFVRQAIDEAREEHGWTVTDLASHTGVGRSTVFRWLAGDWQDYPELAKVRGFCAALDLPVAAAFRALGLPDAGPGAVAAWPGRQPGRGRRPGDPATAGGSDGARRGEAPHPRSAALPRPSPDPPGRLTLHSPAGGGPPPCSADLRPGYGTAAVNSAVRTSPPVAKSR